MTAALAATGKTPAHAVPAYILGQIRHLVTAQQHYISNSYMTYTFSFHTYLHILLLNSVPSGAAAGAVLICCLHARPGLALGSAPALLTDTAALVLDQLTASCCLVLVILAVVDQG